MCHSTGFSREAQFRLCEAGAVSDTSVSYTPADRDLTSIADLIEDPAHADMLAALAGGRALPGGGAGSSGRTAACASPRVTTTTSENGWPVDAGVEPLG